MKTDGGTNSERELWERRDRSKSRAKKQIGVRGLREERERERRERAKLNLGIPQMRER